MKPLDSSHILVTGIIRDGVRTLEKDLERIRSAFSHADKLSFFIVESDSDDSTPELLDSIEKRTLNFRFVSLGRIQPLLNDRTERLALCRNRYLEEVFEYSPYSDVDYVAVADLDGVNNLIGQFSVDRNWEIGEWDAVFCNQDGPYYDIWALRHPLWSPTDCKEQYLFLNGIDGRPWRNQRTAIRGKMVKIPASSEPIAVDSAFGGFAIYRREALNGAKYAGSDLEGRPASEHVHFHQLMRAGGKRLLINPGFITGSINEHSSTIQYLIISLFMLLGRWKTKWLVRSVCSEGQERSSKKYRRN